MFKKLFGNKKSDRQSQIDAFDSIANKWNLDDMNNYIKGRKENVEPSDIGLAYILDKLITNTQSDKSYESGKRRELEIEDRPERLKKAFTLVQNIATHAKTSLDTLTLIKEFYTFYADVINAYDKAHSDIYMHRLKEAYKNGHVRALAKSKLENRLQSGY